MRPRDSDKSNFVHRNCTKTVDQRVGPAPGRGRGEAALEAVQPDCEALQVDAHAAGLVPVAQLLIEQQQQVEHRHELREVVALD